MSVKKKYTAEDKAKVALEALRGNLTLNDISVKFQVHSTQINKWKNIARESIVNGFKDDTKRLKENHDLEDELYRQIGQLKVELEWLKKNLQCSQAVRKSLVEPGINISINRQLELLGISKSSYYYKPIEISSYTLELLRLVDKTYTDYPTFGTRSMCSYLYNEYACIVSRDKMRAVYNTLQIRAIYQEPKITVNNPNHKKYPYLLRDTIISAPNHVWSTDITYIPIKRGFIYLSAIIDWYSRYVLSWALNIDMEAVHCVDLLKSTLDQYGKGKIFNTDQGSQYTSVMHTQCLLDNGIQISMDGRGRWADNIFIEKLWRSVKYECIYLNDFALIAECRKILAEYFWFYNTKRPHQSLNGKPPIAVYLGNV